ncbi:potassium transporter Kup [Dyella acidiphila]|uniref:Probable potassium transport system protein Kup n=1 Tax=Dyella acidiphila TaxID=2775866 RepID=A0ABR9GCN9_9GAMM|nr:KUP/HAK/KT family potassium transporter [Dyella acidiphila]MBE1161818.1 KUP/HAK/KT family potassium transporter [Dyella acidiphila]
MVEKTSAADGKPKKSLPALALAATGVVFGDIATSPLYSLQQAFGEQGIKPDHDSVLGLLSLCLYALLIVVTGKYVLVVMRADNHGEGGMMALGALARGAMRGHGRLTWLTIMVGLAGAALFFGDSVITPAISVLSAVEGLQLASPAMKEWVLPIAVTILIGLFLLQRGGSALLGHLFGPIMTLWLLSIAALGVVAIVQNPKIFEAVNPYYAVLYMQHNGFKGFASLGAVVLVLTGAEALYADIGHFGTRPIRVSWLCLALPALLLNYFGQGARLMAQPGQSGQPFFALVPHTLLYPMIVLATLATVIASQAVVSGTFSMVRQSIQLGYLPRARVLHTSKEMEGQIYLPAINMILFVAVMVAVLAFRSSQRLGGAYGIAVSGTMLITTALLLLVAKRQWRWGIFRLVGFGLLFGIIDGAFVAANLLKLPQGGWFPLVVAAIAMLIMTTWRRGRMLTIQRLHAREERLDGVIAKTMADSPLRADGTAVFMTRSRKWAPHALLQNLRHNQVLHQRNIFLHIDDGGDSSRVGEKQRSELQDLGNGFYWVHLRFGFNEHIDVPARLRELGFDPVLEPEQLTYFVGFDELTAAQKKGQMWRWRKMVFIYLYRNALPAVLYYGMPARRLVEIGTRVDL